MRIIVKAKPRARKQYVERTGETSFTVAVKEAPEKGRANQSIINALAEKLNLSPSSISIISGKASKVKVFEVEINLAGIDKKFSTPQLKLI